MFANRGRAARMDSTLTSPSLAPPLPLARQAARPALVAIVALTALFGVGVAALIAPHVWSVDANRNLAAARDLLAGRFGIDRGYLYSPLAALLTVPATWLPAGLAIGAWLGAKLAVLAWGVRHESAGLTRIDAVLVGLGTLAFVPTVHDLLLGNVTVLVVAAIAVAAWRRDGWTAGVALGLILATAPKPQLAPVLVWMFVFRPRALRGAVLTAALSTGATIAFLGTGPYLAWIDVLRAPAYLSSPMSGNLAPQALLPPLAVPIWALTLAGFIAALRRSETAGFIAALATGLLVAPYTMAYSAMALLLAVRPLALRAPTATAILSAAGSLSVIVLLPGYALAWLGAAAGLPGHGRPFRR